MDLVTVDMVLGTADVGTTSEVLIVVLALEGSSAFAEVAVVDAVDAVEASSRLDDVELCEVAELDEDEDPEQERSYKGVVLRVVPTTPKLGLGVVG